MSGFAGRFLAFVWVLGGLACTESPGDPDGAADAALADAGNSSRDAQSRDALAPDASEGDAGAADAGADAGVGADAETFPDAASVGPGPGFSVAASSTVGSSATFGTDVSLELDEQGAPMLAYVWEAPAGVAANGAVYFVRWDDGARRWTVPVRVEVIGPVFTNVPLRHISLSRDPATGVLGIAYGRFNTRTPPRNEIVYSVHLAISHDGGQTWSSERISERMDQASGAEEAYAPALKLRDRQIHVAYPQRWQHCSGGTNGACHGLWYLTRTGTTGAFQRTLAPLLAGTSGVRMTSIALALDALGAPGVAYFSNSDAPNAPDSNTTNLTYWRPGVAPIRVDDSRGVQNDAPALSLAYRENAPRIAADLVRDQGRSFDVRLWASADHTTWTSSVAIPRDGGDIMSWYHSLAIRSDGALALASGSHSTAGGAQSVCSAPKLARSSDGTQWTTCGMSRAELPSGTGGYVNAAFGPNGKLWVAFQQPESNSAPNGPGIVVWREP